MVVNFRQVPLTHPSAEEKLRSELAIARQNERRWLSEPCLPDPEQDAGDYQEWLATAKLRRAEVEKLESLLAVLTAPAARAS